MTTPFKCFVGLLKPRLSLPTPFTLDDRTITDYFREGSTPEGGSPAIELTVDAESRLRLTQIEDDRPTDTYDLQRCLTMLTRNSPYPGRVSRIGLIFADRLDSHPGVVGMMFDMGFNPAGIRAVGPDYLAKPREGCAVFLDAIRDLRRGSSPAYQREAMFTAIHELGHVFNLWHNESPKRFMSSSESNGAFGPTAFQFHNDHVKFLAKCDVSEHVWPGGSNFGDRGTDGPAETDYHNRPESRVRVDLQIGCSNHEFWRFEPVELDVWLKVPDDRKSVLMLADKVDPGYEGFSLFIERPDGSRYLFDSPRKYCQNFGKIRIEAGKPYARDISLHAQSGGFTFDTAGRHTIQAVFDMGGGKVIRSNRLEVEVLASRPRSGQYRALEKFLTEPAHALFLYHRNSGVPPKLMDSMDRFVRRSKRQPVVSHIRYSLARSLTRVSHESTDEHRDAHHQLARRYGEAAHGMKETNGRRRWHLEKIIKRLSRR